MTRYFEKERIIVASALCAGLATLFCLRAGVDLQSLLALARLSARSAFPLFFFSFIASALYTWRQHMFCAWCLRNRRELGLGFSLIQFFHLAVLVTIALRHPEHFADGKAWTFVPGALFFLALGMLTVTSFSGWKSRIPRPIWKRLHRFCVHVIWLGYALASAMKAVDSGRYFAVTALMLAALAFRWWGWRRRETKYAKWRLDRGGN